MGKITGLVCSGCQSVFNRATKEVTRQRKKHGHDVPFYCSSKCHSETGGKTNLGLHLGEGRPANLRVGSEQDEFSAYRVFLKLAKQRKDKECDLDLPYLRNLWISQKGQCGITGVPMDLPPKMAAWYSRTKDPMKPSLDRIDNREGYTKGNVRYVTVLANLARSTFKDSDVVDFCLKVAKHQN